MGVNPRSARQQKIAQNLREMKPFTGTINAAWDPENETYTVRSYDTPIGEVRRSPSGTRTTRHLSQQQFTRTTTQHQRIIAQHLPGEEGEPIGEQHWTQYPHGISADFERGSRSRTPFNDVSHLANPNHPRFGAATMTQAQRRALERNRPVYSPDMGGGARLQDLFSDRRSLKGPISPTRHIDAIENLEIPR